LEEPANINAIAPKKAANHAAVDTATNPINAPNAFILFLSAKKTSGEKNKERATPKIMPGRQIRNCGPDDIPFAHELINPEKNPRGINHHRLFIC
jgi:hypothetical protein